MEKSFDHLPIRFGAYTISEMREAYIDDLVKISEISVGKGYFNHAYFEDYLTNENKWSLICLQDDKPVGFSLLENTSVENFVAGIQKYGVQIRKLLAKKNQLIIRRVTAVHPEHRGNGLASHMVKQAVNVADKGADAMLSIAWKSKRGIHIKTPLESNGFKPILFMPSFYYARSVARSFKCPQCGEPPCQCDAVLYINELG